MRVWPGQPYPLGATWNGVGVNFALFSANATRVELCLFDSADATAESVRIDLPDRDGENHNLSWNCGVEGPTDDPAITELRRRQTRNMLATLVLSQGVPMLSHGDELGRTQQGNNNAYCQGNELTWIDWNLTSEQKALCEFTRQLIHLRLSEPVLRRRKYFQGRSIRGGKDVAWLAPDGQEMTDEAWGADFVHSIGMLLSGAHIQEVDESGEPIVGDTLLVLLNAHHDRVAFALPGLDPDHHWQRVFDTFDPGIRQAHIFSLTRTETVRSGGSSDPPNTWRRYVAAGLQTRRTRGAGW